MLIKLFITSESLDANTTFGVLLLGIEILWRLTMIEYIRTMFVL